MELKRRSYGCLKLSWKIRVLPYAGRKAAMHDVVADGGTRFK